MTNLNLPGLAAGLLLAAALPAVADTLTAPEGEAPPDFDIVSATARLEHHMVHFGMAVAGTAGGTVPQAAGDLAGAPVFAYVWPLSADPSAVGFQAGSGTLALVATAHPDFDDTPLYDENGDGDPANDGASWHTHWVVLVPDEACGPGALKVADIAGGEDIAMPETAPGLPILLDSPEVAPAIEAHAIAIEVPADDLSGARFDGVTASLAVSLELKAPLLCVTEVFDVASGDLSLPGMIGE